MTNLNGGFLGYDFAVAMAILGFHGVFFHAHLLRKAGSWVVFQLGIFFLAWHLGAPGAESKSGANPFARALAFEILGVTLAVACLLFSMGFFLRRRFGSFESDEIIGKIRE